jgi:Zn/Cd-binding protein ZinT
MWNALSKFLNVIFFIWNIYLYLENRKLRGFEIDKNIKLKKREIEELKQLYKKEKKESLQKLQSMGRITTGFKEEKEEELKLKYENKKAKLNTELSHLKKQKKYKWLFSKDC